MDGGQDQSSSFQEWRELAARYRNGTAALDTTRRPVQQPGADALTEPETDPSAERARLYYEREGYLPSLENPREEERRRVLRRFRLHEAHEQGRFPIIDQITHLAKAVFAVDAVLVNVVTENGTFFVASTGWTSDNRAQVEYTIDGSLCPHAMSKPASAGAFQIPDTSADWRFKENPLAVADRPIGFFASANINLPQVTSSNGGEPDRLPVGSLCLVHPTALPALDAQQEAVLQQLALVVAKELEMSFQRDRQALYEVRAEYLSELVQHLVIQPRGPAARPSPRTSPRPIPTGFAQRVCQLCGSDFALLLDIRGTSVADQSLSMSPKRLVILDAATAEQAAHEVEQLEAAFKSDVGSKSVESALADWYRTEQASFALPLKLDSATLPCLDTPLAANLPPQTSALMAVPLFDHDSDPSLFLITGSYARHFEYEPSDERFLRNIGGVVLTGLLQEKILQGDQAKLRFVGHVSHELRTPIFAIGGQLELIRDLAETDRDRIAPLLDVAETCLSTLRDILNDTLEYTSLATTSNDDEPVVAIFADVDDLATEVIQTSWTRKQSDSCSSLGRIDNNLDIVYKSLLPAEMSVKIDVGGLKRVLLILIDNAIKFTPAPGTITLTASFECSTGSETEGTLRFSCADSGCGMSSAFLSDSLHKAFEQADAFAGGAGVSVPIASAIVQRLGGKLAYSSTEGVGTTVDVFLPVEISFKSDARKSLDRPRCVIRSISAELVSLHALRPSRPVPTLSESFVTNSESSRASPAPSSEATTPSELGTSSRSTNPYHAVRTLVVDDNPVARKIYSAYLRGKGVAFVEANDGAEAVELFKSFRPNLVWCDIQMPRMDGIEASRLMRLHEVASNLSPARILAVSGLDSNLGKHEKLLTSGQIDVWLVKTGKTLKALGDDLLSFGTELLQTTGAVDELQSQCQRGLSLTANVDQPL